MNTEETKEIADRRAKLVETYGADNVFSTDEMCEKFVAIGFGAPRVRVRRKSDGVEGHLYFDHSPRFYYDFRPA